MLQELRELGLSQAMIAREMGSNRQTVNQWFTGERSPSARSVSRMAAAITALTGKTYYPADVYNLICCVLERKEKERDEEEKEIV